MKTEEAKRELARRSLYYYCRLRAPDFYKPERQYLRELCEKAERFIKSDKRVMLINMPPRHGKSRTACLMCEYLLGRDKGLKIMTASYNETLSTMFSRSVRDALAEKRVGGSSVFSDVFPGVSIKGGSSGMWSIKGESVSYLATSPKGSATGFGANIIIIDDIIRSAEEAMNEGALEAQWRWFTDTMLSRLEDGGEEFAPTAKVIVIMTRWANGDLAGRIEKEFTSEKLCVLRYKALDNGKMLCEDILSRSAYEERIRLTSPEIVSANYDQEPMDIKGRLYSDFGEYDEVPQGEVLSYTDTADTGSDYLCSIIFTYSGGYAYVLDVLYTRESMEITEKLVAESFDSFKVVRARIESNNGGRGFARAVKGRLKGCTHITTFHQSAGKATRILVNSAWVNGRVLFPKGWQSRWHEFYGAVSSYNRIGKNAHDDAPDALSGVAETVQKYYGGI